MVNDCATSILIFANGSHTIGLGHIFRMRALAEALRGKFRISFLSQDDDVANKLLRSAGFTVHSFAPDRVEEFARDAVRREQPAVLLLDILDTSEPFMKLLRTATKAPIICFDDCGAGLNSANAVVNMMASLGNRYNPAECKARLFEGPRYMIFSLALRGYIRNAAPTPGPVWKLLLTFGGSDTHFITQRALDALNQVGTRLDITVNLGPSTLLSTELQNAVSVTSHRVTVAHALPNLYERMRDADLVLCSGGMTLFEAAAQGVPSISIAAEPHEVFSIENLAKAGASMALGWERTLDFSRLAGAVADLQVHPERLAPMSAAGMAHVDGLGLERVVEIVDQMLRGS